jgi:hypothetical protein
MKLFVGNCSEVVDCNNLIDICKQSGGHTMHGPQKIDAGQPMYEEYKEQYDLMVRGGYLNNNSIRFTHYYPDQHFDVKIAENFAKFCGVKHFGSFVSSIDPGFCAPWHKDIFNNYYKNLSMSYNLERFVMFLSEPTPGAGFILNDEVFYMEQQGNAYKFPEVHDWHAGFNVGFETKFILTLTGARI